MKNKVSKLDDSDDGDDILNLEFEGFTPEVADCDGVAILLKNLFPDESIIDAQALALHLVSLDNFGTVLKSISDDDEEEGEEDGIIFSITSTIDLGEKEANKVPVIKTFRELLIRQINILENSESKTEILKLFHSKSKQRPFLLINERFENLPVSVCLDAMSALPSELENVDLSPTHFIVLALASRNGDNGEFHYVYPELSGIRKFAKHCVQLNVDDLFKNVSKKVGGSNESIDSNALFLIVFTSDAFGDVLGEMKSNL